jgi:hypothetical protein
MKSTQLIKICAKSDDVSIYDITTIVYASLLFGFLEEAKIKATQFSQLILEQTI